MRVLSDGRVFTVGATGAGWTSSEVTVPVAPLAHSVSPVTLCVQLSDLNGEVEIPGVAHLLLGGGDRRRANGSTGQAHGSNTCARGTSRGCRSSSARRQAHQLGRAWSGIWIVFFILALALSVVALTSWSIVRELR